MSISGGVSSLSTSAFNTWVKMGGASGKVLVFSVGVGSVGAGVVLLVSAIGGVKAAAGGGVGGAEGVLRDKLGVWT